MIISLGTMLMANWGNDYLLLDAGEELINKYNAMQWK